MKHIFIIYPRLNHPYFSPIYTCMFNYIARYARKHPCTAEQKISLIYRLIEF